MMTKPPEEKFHGCMLGKQNKKSYLVNPVKVRSTILEQFIHGDICGPMWEQSIGGARYFILSSYDFNHGKRYRNQTGKVSK
jgi:hypothetical protein